MVDDLKDLGRKLDKAGENYAPKEKTDNSGLRMGAELIGPIFAGTFIGWFIDDKAGTKPFFLISFFLLGVVTGFFNIWRTSRNLGSQVGYSGLHKDKKNARNPADDQES